MRKTLLAAAAIAALGMGVATTAAQADYYDGRTYDYGYHHYDRDNHHYRDVRYGYGDRDWYWRHHHHYDSHDDYGRYHH
jgi:hypothetical protein